MLKPHVEAMQSNRLAALSASLGGKEYLEGRFAAGDIVMTTVPHELVDCGALSQFPILDAYRRRCEARPAFGRALEAQMQPFRENAPA
jgi:glutathione S-transferase